MSASLPDFVLDDQHPWPGLAAFGEDSRNFFFGREDEEEELFRRLRRDRTILLYGQSGLGKTSLLQAGLLPRLRGEGLAPVLVRLRYREDLASPSAQLRELLAEAFAPPDGPGGPGANESLWEYLHSRRNQEGTRVPWIPVFIFDQFEEAFTLGLRNEAVRRPTQLFLDEMADLIEDRCPAAVRARLEADPDLIANFASAPAPYHIVIALREDYLPQMLTLRSRAPSLARTSLRLKRMSGDNALEAVEFPGRALLEPDAAEQIVRLVGRPAPEDPFVRAPEGADMPLSGLEVEPFLLSLYCSELNELRLRAGELKITADAVKFNREAIVESFYERSFRGLPRALRDFVEWNLLTGTGQRESVSIDRAEQLLGPGEANRAALQELIRRRLLQVEERFEVPRIELTHDLLAAVAMRSRKKRGQRRREVRLGGLALAAVLLVAAFMIRHVLSEHASTVPDSQSALLSNTKRELSESERVLKERAKQSQTAVDPLVECAQTHTRKACSAFLALPDDSLVDLVDADVASQMLNVRSIAATTWDLYPDLSIDMVRKGVSLLRRRRADKARDLTLAQMLFMTGQLERQRANRKPGTAKAGTDRSLAPARSDLTSAREILRNLGAAQPVAAAAPGDARRLLGSVDAALAIVDPTQRKDLLAEALEISEEAVRYANSRSDKLARASALGTRAWRMVLSGRPDDAIADTRRALVLDPRQYWILGNEADAWLMKRESAKAMSIFAGIQNKPGIPPHATLRGTICDDMAALARLELIVREDLDRVEKQYDCGHP